MIQLLMFQVHADSSHHWLYLRQGIHSTSIVVLATTQTTIWDMAGIELDRVAELHQEADSVKCDAQKKFLDTVVEEGKGYKEDQVLVDVSDVV